MDDELTDISTLGGKAEISIGKLTIEPQFLSEIHVELTEGERTIESLAGNITKPSGMIDSAQVAGNFILPSMDALKVLFQEAYEAPTAEGLAGKVSFGSNSCKTKVPLPVNIHYTCEQNGNNDVHIYAGLIKADLDLTYNQSDALTIPFTIYAQPTSKGYAFAGAHDQTKPTIYDPTTNTWKDVPNAPTETTASRIAKINNK